MKRLNKAGSRGLGRRATLGMVDQVVSSATNFALNVLVVSSVTTDAYGAFALVFALYLVFQGAIEALVSQPLLVRHTEQLEGAPTDEAGARRTYEHALGGGLLLGLCGSAMLVVGALFCSGQLRTSLFVLAVTLPGLMVQDVMRGVYFAKGQPVGAVVIDSIWAVAQLVLIGSMIGTGTTQVPWLVLAWGLSGGVSVLPAMAFERLPTRLLGTARWLIDLRSLSVPFFGEIMTMRVASQSILFMLAGVAGIGAVGVFRSAQVLFSPVNVLLLAVPMVGIPEAVRLLRRRPDRFRATMIGGGAVFTAGVGLWCGAVLLLPASIGEKLLGQSWGQVSQILPESSIFYLAAAAGVGAIIGLRALAAARTTFAARAVSGAAGLGLGTIGAIESGASGAALGLGVGTLVGCVLLWVGFIRHARSAELTPGESAVDGDDQGLGETSGLTQTAGQPPQVV